MGGRLLRHLFLAVLQIGADPADSDDLRLKKRLLVASVNLIFVAGIVWGGIYLYFDEPAAAISPIAYSALSIINIVIFGRTHRFESFRVTQLCLILLLPFLLMLALGGFATSSAVIIWSFLCPAGAILLAEPREATRWFLAYLALLLTGGLAQPFLRPTNHLPPEANLAFFVMNIGAVSTIAFLLLWYFVSQKATALSLLRLEQDKSEALLLNILPKAIAEELKHERLTIADRFDQASILFADMVNFTRMAAAMTPEELVGLLNEVFSHFDALVERYGLEKIKTVGDCYMVAAGVPNPRADHAQALAALALDLCAYVQTLPPRHGLPIEFRIGISSGPVIAGVIGRWRFIYDMWGDSVNTASRMESHGTAGMIQITRETYELVNAEFLCVPRGRVEVKGKGSLDTWYLQARRVPGVVG